MDSKKTVLIIDAGGRGAALVDKYAQSKHVGKILAVPGNDLMKLNTTKIVKTYPELKTTSIKEILKICQDENVDLVDVAQDNAVAAGVADEVKKLGISVIGPTKKAGRIEWDKAWARKFMTRYKIPQPAYKICKSEEEGIKYLDTQPDRSWFVKAYGLAEGKGAIPAKNNGDALIAISEMSKFGEAGKVFLLEEWLAGEEFSTFILLDGKDYKIVGSAQDHKRLNNGDKGPNTGGMGCSTPPLVLTDKIMKKVEEKIIKPVVEGLYKEDLNYQGVLYLGGILVNKKNVIPVSETHPESGKQSDAKSDSGGANASQNDSTATSVEYLNPYVIEFNARWGDPEAEVILPGIENDIYEVSMAVVESRIKNLEIRMDGKARVAVAAASKGYPKDYSKAKGKQIYGLDKAFMVDGVRIYGAGVKVLPRHPDPVATGEGSRFITSGGRLFYVVGEGKDVIEARERAYKAMQQISIEGDNLHYRRDIGYRDVERLKVD